VWFGISTEIQVVWERLHAVVDLFPQPSGRLPNFMELVWNWFGSKWGTTKKPWMIDDFQPILAWEVVNLDLPGKFHKRIIEHPEIPMKFLSRHDCHWAVQPSNDLTSLEPWE